jgi:type IV pilus assembly protein PilN
MIRVNLLAVERGRAKKVKPADAGRRVAILGGLILLAAFGGIAWWFWSLGAEAARLDTAIAQAELEARRLDSVLAEVQRFETRRTQLEQRVSLIEQLRKAQSGPVRVLDDISRGLPDMLWLVEMKQKGSELTIDGRAASLIGLSDFVGNLERSPHFDKPVEIVDTQVESVPPATDIVKFTLKATLVGPVR